MTIKVYWDNLTRSHIDRGEFGKGMSFKRKLGFKPASLSRSIEITMADKISMTWKRELQAAVSDQFQMNRKGTVYIVGCPNVKQSHFVISARNAKSFSNQVANGILQIIANTKGKNHIDNINELQLIR